MSRVLLVSTYELGSRPLGCAVPAAMLGEAGHEVRSVDLALGPLDDATLWWAEVLAISVPMHTAARLGLDLLRRVRAQRSDLPICLHGLYALAAADAAGDLLGPRDLAAAGDAGPALLAFCDEAGKGASASTRLRRRVELGPAQGATRPAMDTTGLPGLERYARLVQGAHETLVATVETTTGCNHRCRHCPVPVIYRGRSRPVPLEVVAEEVGNQLDEGARHVHLADADFLNRPAHALGFARWLAGRHPGVTFDATVKISHLLRHGDLLGELKACGLLFVTSAIESTSDVVLERLDKGHRRADAAAAVRQCRRQGIELRPSFLPFTPWTTRRDLIDLLDFVAEEDLVWSTDAVQYAIRLLLPPGSLLLKDPDLVLSAALGDAESDGLGTSWRSPDPVLDDCQREVATLVESLALTSATPADAYEQVRALIHAVLHERDAGAPTPALARVGGPGPRLSEAWFCCAEPTSAQLATLAGACAASPEQAAAPQNGNLQPSRPPPPTGTTSSGGSSREAPTKRG